MLFYVWKKQLQEKEDKNLMEPNVRPKIKLRPDKSGRNLILGLTLHAGRERCVQGSGGEAWWKENAGETQA
jgi:hypothetical protein